MRLVLIVLLLLVINSCQQPARTEYCGNITEKMILPKGKSSSVCYLIYYVPELQRNVAVEVSMNTYVNRKVGDRICFKLSEYEIR